MPEDSPESVTLSKKTVMRLVKDVRSLTAEPLTDHGIHYCHSESDILKGRALIIGPKDTPYANGFYLFELTFPSDYPHRPPVVKFCTNDGSTRMHPNLYKCGKVCVSILNTWRGDAWTGCQTISTVLLSLASLLDSKPLLNEPGISEDHRDFGTYNRIVAYKNIDTAIRMALRSSSLQSNFSPFVDTMKSHFVDNYGAVVEQVKDSDKANPDSRQLITNVYRMHIVVSHDSLLEELGILYKELAKLK